MSGRRLAVTLLVGICATSVLALDKRPLTATSISAVFQGFTDELTSVMAIQETNHGRSMLAKPSFHGFLDGFYGKNWTDVFPKKWLDVNLTWDGNLPFDLRSGAADFFHGNLSGLDGNMSLIELHDLFEKVDPSCTGPSVTLAYNPKVCVVDESRKQIICTPASVTLTKTPGVCVKHKIAPAVFKGKTCAIKKPIGKAVEIVIGGDVFVIDLDKYAEKVTEDPHVSPLAKKVIAKKLHKKFPLPVPPVPVPEPVPEIEPVVPSPEPSPSPIPAPSPFVT
ncbi:hypothetical protein QBZ16_000106 [Prototheca wickerhamii]|uniref:Uncharacterized protein n=1 Tax=Prototheca wickerhamii TaxID=3111 RepID=A0AAD9MMV4_PROWI|nr:hypothetical protein QBZ16_000106 [Prototheca wickerhamii]